MSRHISLLGLPHAGKTAWLGRVWVAADTRRGRIQRHRTPDNPGDLKRLSDWLYEAKYPDHTAAQGAPDFNAELAWVGAETTRPFSLHVSDYSGEQVNALYQDRGAWSDRWEARAQAEGLVVVVRADRLTPPRASRLQRLAPRQDDAMRLLGQSMMPDRAVRDLDGPEALPTGLALVELLQLLRGARGLGFGEAPDPARHRVVVLLTAWDRYAELGRPKSPRAFMEEHLGLLDDFLVTNYDHAGFKVFGLSTTGGDLNDVAYAKTYAEGEPENFGFVDWDGPDGVRQDQDVTLPLGWLLEGDSVLP